MLANSTKPLLDVSLQKLGLPLRTHSGRRGQHPQWWWHRGPLELRAGKVLNHTAKELKDQLSRLSEEVGFYERQSRRFVPLSIFFFGQ